MFLALALALAATPTVEASSFSAAEPEVPRAIVSIYPLATGASGLVSATTRMGVFWLPVGLQLPMSERLVLEVEAGFAWMSPGGGDGWAVTASAGPTWFPFASKKALTGFFIGPRFQLQIGEAGRVQVISASAGPLDAGPNVRRSFLVGFDLGWQFRLGPVVLGPVLGASAGYSFDSDWFFATPFEVTTFGNPNRKDTFAFALNLNLFRLGIAL